MNTRGLEERQIRLDGIGGIAIPNTLPIQSNLLFFASLRLRGENWFVILIRVSSCACFASHLVIKTDI